MTNFIFGILFAIILLPIADGFTQVVLTWLELIKSHIGIKLTENNNKIQSSVPTNSHAIGFSVPDIVEDELEDEEDDL